ncbi:MAG: ABC transporter substrate-binding protein [Methanoregula sp.]|jgi:peptide/nickel transport system substrate-binding protein
MRAKICGVKRKGFFKRASIAVICTLIIAGSLLGSGLLTGCNNSTQTTAETKVLRYGMSMGPGSIDPTNLVDITSWEMVRQCYNGLTDRTPEGQTMAGLAKTYETTDGGMTYHFVLNQGVKFASGNELKASDVKYTFEHDLDPTRDSSSGTYLMTIVGAQGIADGKTTDLAGFNIINDYEFTVSFTQPEFYFPEYCSIEALYIVEEAAVKDKGENWWETMSAGTGPYILSEYIPDQKIVFTANKNYFEGAPAITTLEFDIVAEDSTAMMMYNNNELDVISAPYAELENIKADAVLSKELVEYPMSDMNYLGMTQDLYAPFKDIRVRQAISLVISPDDIANKVMQGTAYPLYGIIPVGSDGYNTDIQKPEYNPEKARELLKEAGYDANNPLPDITLYYVSADEDNAVYISEQLKNELGWNVKLECPDFSTVLSNLKSRNYAFFIFGSTSTFGDARSILSVSFYSNARRNFSNYVNSTYDSLLDQAATITSHDQRVALYQQAEKAVMDDFGFVPMYTDMNFLRVKPYVTGMKYSGLGMDIMDKVDIQK